MKWPAKIKPGQISNAIFSGEDWLPTFLAAAGEADVNASDFVDIRIRAGGDVFIYGNPERVDESRVIGGRIKRMD